MNNPLHCVECGRTISPGIFEFSTEVYGYALCMKHQAWLADATATPDAITLYLELKSKEIPAVLEFWDGNSTIDIAVPEKMYIEVSGLNHDEPEQAFTELLTTMHSWKEHIPTFRVSNEHIRNIYQLEIIVERISKICKDLKKTA